MLFRSLSCFSTSSRRCFRDSISSELFGDAMTDATGDPLNLGDAPLNLPRTSGDESTAGKLLASGRIPFIGEIVEECAADSHPGPFDREDCGAAETPPLAARASSIRSSRSDSTCPFDCSTRYPDCA